MNTAVTTRPVVSPGGLSPVGPHAEPQPLDGNAPGRAGNSTGVALFQQGEDGVIVNDDYEIRLTKNEQTGETELEVTNRKTGEKNTFSASQLGLDKPPGFQGTIDLQLVQDDGDATTQGNLADGETSTLRLTFEKDCKSGSSTLAGATFVAADGYAAEVGHDANGGLDIKPVDGKTALTDPARGTFYEIGGEQADGLGFATPIDLRPQPKPNGKPGNDGDGCGTGDTSTGDTSTGDNSTPTPVTPTPVTPTPVTPTPVTPTPVTPTPVTPTPVTPTPVTPTPVTPTPVTPTPVTPTPVTPTPVTPTPVTPTPVTPTPVTPTPTPPTGAARGVAAAGEITVPSEKLKEQIQAKFDSLSDDPAAQAAFHAEMTNMVKGAGYPDGVMPPLTGAARGIARANGWGVPNFSDKAGIASDPIGPLNRISGGIAELEGDPAAQQALWKELKGKFEAAGWVPIETYVTPGLWGSAKGVATADAIPVPAAARLPNGEWDVQANVKTADALRQAIADGAAKLKDDPAAQAAFLAQMKEKTGAAEWGSAWNLIPAPSGAGPTPVPPSGAGRGAAEAENFPMPDPKVPFAGLGLVLGIAAKAQELQNDPPALSAFLNGVADKAHEAGWPDDMVSKIRNAKPAAAPPVTAAPAGGAEAGHTAAETFANFIPTEGLSKEAKNALKTQYQAQISAISSEFANDAEAQKAFLADMTEKLKGGGWDPEDFNLKPSGKNVGATHADAVKLPAITYITNSEPGIEGILNGPTTTKLKDLIAKEFNKIPADDVTARLAFIDKMTERLEAAGWPKEKIPSLLIL
jgi:hypothetical protein